MPMPMPPAMMAKAAMADSKFRGSRPAAPTSPMADEGGEGMDEKLHFACEKCGAENEVSVSDALENEQGGGVADSLEE